HADLFLVGENGFDGIAAGAPVDSIGLETLLIEPTLNLLYLLECGGALAARKLLTERRVAADQIAKVAKRQRIAGGWIVRINRAEILSHQESRPTCDRHPQLHLVTGTREGHTVSATHREFLPLGV